MESPSLNREGWGGSPPNALSFFVGVEGADVEAGAWHFVGMEGGDSGQIVGQVAGSITAATVVEAIEDEREVFL